jgi:hypothetical protein
VRGLQQLIVHVPAVVQFIWEAVSHELGHTLGLLHDGVAANPASPTGQAYFWGQGNWAPIMVRTGQQTLTPAAPQPAAVSV